MVVGVPVALELTMAMVVVVAEALMLEKEITEATIEESANHSAVVEVVVEGTTVEVLWYPSIKE